MAAPRFDPTRPFGTIHPPLEGAFYEQNGVLYDNEMQFLRDPAAKEAAKPASAPRTAPAKPAVVEPEGNGEVDLAAWARKEKHYAFFTVKAAIVEKFPGAEVTDTKSAVAVLVEKGVLPAEEVGR